MKTDQPCFKKEDDNIPQTEIRWTSVETNLDDPETVQMKSVDIRWYILTYMLTIDITDINNVCVIPLLKLKQP